MKLEGSCHCRAVRFVLESPHPYPYNLCYCSICRKTAGGGGFAINISGDSNSMDIKGKESLKVYRAKIVDDETGEVTINPGERNFCGICGSALWVWDPRWPDLIHPFASAIDSKLPIPPEQSHMMLDFKANWVEPRINLKDQLFNTYPVESIAMWHERLGIVQENRDNAEEEELE